MVSKASLPFSLHCSHLPLLLPSPSTSPEFSVQLRSSFSMLSHIPWVPRTNIQQCFWCFSPKINISNTLFTLILKFILQIVAKMIFERWISDHIIPLLKILGHPKAFIGPSRLCTIWLSPTSLVFSVCHAAISFFPLQRCRCGMFLLLCNHRPALVLLPGTLLYLVNPYSSFRKDFRYCGIHHTPPLCVQSTLPN